MIGGKMRIKMEPDLEMHAGNFTAAQRRELARKLERWAKQLRISAFIIDRDSAPRPRPALKRLSRTQLRRN